MSVDSRPGAEGVATLERHGITYTGQWATTDNRVFVYWNLQENSALIGVRKEPDTLVRISLSDLVRADEPRDETPLQGG